MTITRQHSQWRKKMAWSLYLWQALVFVLAGLCHLIGVGARVSAPADAERLELASLLQPTDQEPPGMDVQMIMCWPELTR